MDPVVQICRELLDLHASILEDYRQRGRAHAERAARYTARAAELESRRAAVQNYLRYQREISRTLYQGALSMLDAAIENGDEQMADTALLVMKDAKAAASTTDF